MEGLIGMGNGITTDGFHKLWAADITYKRILEFDVDYASGDLTLNSKIETGFSSDNIHYDSKTGNVLVSRIAKKLEFMVYTDALRKGTEQGLSIAGGAD